MTHHRIPHRLGHVVLPPDEGQELAAYLMPLPDGDPVALRGTAALIWVVASEGEVDVPGALAELLDTPVEEIRGDVTEYVQVLVADGLLEVVP